MLLSVSTNLVESLGHERNFDLIPFSLFWTLYMSSSYVVSFPDQSSSIVIKVFESIEVNVAGLQLRCLSSISFETGTSLCQGQFGPLGWKAIDALLAL